MRKRRLGAVLLFDALIEVEDRVIRLVADGMDGDLQASGIGLLDSAEHLFRIGELGTRYAARVG